MSGAITMSTATVSGMTPEPKPQTVPALSPPDSNTSLKLDGSDSELSDLEEDDLPKDDLPKEEKELIAEPSYYDGTVPVFEPNMEDFHDFERYMKAVNKYGMKSGIVKIRPPQEWKDKLPRYDEHIKPLKLRDAIKQDIMGTAGTYRQANIVSQRSYNLPQWRGLCEQSDHQPPAKRGERRANQEKPKAVVKAKPKKKAVSRRSSKKGGDDEPEDQRLPTPESPNGNGEDEEERKPAATSVSARRKYNRKEAATRIDEEAFKDFDYELHEEFSREKCEELERAYWKTLTYAPPLYGADMVGTLFDDKVKEWNLGALPNLLDVLGTKIPGVNTAYLYWGMWKATFAWHLEDVDLYSINYLHFGAPKQWYSISQGDARKFEAAMKNVWPVDAKACDQFLRHKTFLISPSTLLNQYGIKVNKIVHHPGEFVVTFPYGYHSGYNLGYNCAEAVNFALDSWMDFGRIAKRCDCDAAQDSVWIDIKEIERKLNGDPTDDEMGFGEDDEDEEMNDMPTPPDSNGELRPKSKNNKRKRPGKDAAGRPSFKKIKLRLKAPPKEPCALCPWDISTEPLLETTDGRKVHRICAEFIPETEIEISDGKEIVYGVEFISKDRFRLDCKLCRSKKGACFQCSRGKCPRSYHATCAAAAMVFVERGDTAVFGPDDTEYSKPSIEFACRYCRAKRPQMPVGPNKETKERLKLTGLVLEKEADIIKAALDLEVGDHVQFRLTPPNAPESSKDRIMDLIKKEKAGKDSKDSAQFFAGTVIENSRDEYVLLVKVLPHCTDTIEVEYKYLRIPEPEDFQMVKPSAKAVPLPKESLAIKARLTNDNPRPGDVFLPGLEVSKGNFWTTGSELLWHEFSTFDSPQKPIQTKVELAKTDQLWHYVGEKSTESTAHYSRDPSKRQSDLKSTDPKLAPPIPHFVTPKPSVKASAISTPTNRSNQNALNAVRYTSRQETPTSASTFKKPYVYKPKAGQSAQAQFQVQSKASPAAQYYSQPSHTALPQSLPRPADTRTASQYTNWSPQYTPGSATAAPRQYPPSPLTVPKSSYNPGSFVGYRPTGNDYTKPHRQNGGGNAPLVKDVFVKYPYLRIEHNHSPSSYKSPYKQGGGFMNGYEGNLAEHLRRNPKALAQFGVPSKADYAPILPPGKARATGSEIRSSQPPIQESRQSSSQPWEKKSSGSLHPAIRPHLHQGYGPLANQQSGVDASTLKLSQKPPSVAVSGGHHAGQVSNAAPKYDPQPILPPKYTSQRQSVGHTPPPTATPYISPTAQRTAGLGICSQSTAHPKSATPSISASMHSDQSNQPPSNPASAHASPVDGLTTTTQTSEPKYPSPLHVQTDIAPLKQPVDQASQPKEIQSTAQAPPRLYAHQAYFQGPQSALPQPTAAHGMQLPPLQMKSNDGTSQFMRSDNRILDLPPDSSSILEKMLTNLRTMAGSER